jgi:adenosylcobinamide-phosphate synthase
LPLSGLPAPPAFLNREAELHFLASEQPVLALLVALGADALWGEPSWLYRWVPHPVVAIGRLAATLERRFLRVEAGAAHKRSAGLSMLAAILITATGAGWLITALLHHVSAGWIFEGLAMSTCLAQRSLVDHVGAVTKGLRMGLDQGRSAVALIVGRDPGRLDAAGVGRAAVESLAENLSDGVVAPLFWGMVAGLPGMLAYKAVNTLDSLVGYRSDRYRDFGWASARLDDLANLLPARLTGVLLCLCGGAPLRSITAMARDASRHCSPNAGWPEAAMAACLGVRLAGPRVYAGVTVDDAWMGDGRAEVGPAEIERAIGLAWRVWWLLVAAVALALAFSF